MGELEEKLEKPTLIENPHENKMKRPEEVKRFPEEVSEGNILEMGKKAKELDLENSKEILTTETDSDKLNPEIQAEVLKEGGITEKLEGIQEKARAILVDAKTGINKLIATGMATMAFLGAGDFREAKANESLGETLTIESIQNDQEKIYEEAMEKIRQIAISDTNENSFVIAKKDGKYIIKEARRGDKRSSYFGRKEIEECVEEGVDEMEFIHTHPARLIDQNDEHMGDKIKNGEMREILMPPSFTDIFSLVNEKDVESDFGGKDAKVIKIREKVVDPFNEWEYSYPENSNLFLLIKEIKNNSLEEMINYAELNSQEKKALDDLIEKNSEILNEEHPANYLMKLAIIMNSCSDINIKNGLNKLLIGFGRKDREIREKYGDTYNDLDRIVLNERNISDYGSQESQKLIEENIELYKKNGVILIRKSF